MTRTSKKWLTGSFFLVVTIGVFLAVRQHNNKDQVYVEVKSIHSKQGWGYDILTDGKVYIHQEFIPAVSGRYGFRTEEDALKVGRKVIAKISQGGLPAITIADLKELGIVYDSVAGR